MNAVHKRRLLKLAEHLESGKLGHKKFDFAVINDGAEPYKCGTAGCAVGEMPIAFPNQWKWGQYEPILRAGEHADDTPDNDRGTFSDVEIFFGINEWEARHLFVPLEQVPEQFGGRELGYNAKRQSVAKNIRAFVARNG